MTIEWNKVTWYSKLLAVILFVLTFCIGFKLGEEKTMIQINEAATPSTEATSHFIDSNETFSFDYNPSFLATEMNKNDTLDWKLNSKQKGTFLANVAVERTYEPKTNFASANLTVGRSGDVNAIISCAEKENFETMVGLVNINGLPFTKFKWSDAGAGNFYDTTSYRGIVDGDCYVIEYTVHSTNIGNYSPDQGIKEFNKQKIENEFEKILYSFKFLINSD